MTKLFNFSGFISINIYCFSRSCYILGLLTVNLAHEFMKTYEHKYILPATILISWISLFIAQWIIENMFKATTEFSLIIDLVGGIYFIYLLIKRNED